MSVKKRIDFLLKNPLFPIRLLNLRARLRRIKRGNRQTWIFQCDFKGHFPYLKPYWEIAKQNGAVEVFFCFGTTEQEKPTQFLIGNGVPSDRILDPIDLVLGSNWDVYMSPTEWGNIFPANRDCLRAQIFHTLADKGLEYSDELLKFNTIFACGSLHHEFLEKYIFSKHPGAREKCTVHDIGYAKIDDLYNDALDTKEIKRSFGIPENDLRPVVLYAPNWEAGSALRTYGEAVFRELAIMKEYIVLIKLHYMSLLNPAWHYATGGVDWKAVITPYGEHPHVRIVADTNINRCLKVADLMLTDYGGASLEFLTMDKPIVYLDCPGFFDERGHDVFEKKARDTGYIIDNAGKIAETVRRALLEDNAAHRELRRELSAGMLYNRGTAAAAGFSALLQSAAAKNGGARK